MILQNSFDLKIWESGTCEFFSKKADCVNFKKEKIVAE